MSPGRRVSFYNQGCRLNQAETSALQGQFQDKGFDVVDAKAASDIVIVNTCTVTQNGDADTRRLVHKINRRNPGAKIALIGCQAQILKAQLLALPNVQWVVGNAAKMSVDDIVLSTEKTGETQVVVPPIARNAFSIAHAAVDRSHTRANLKIQDGCDFYCAFCIIPFARGPARSREFEDVHRDAIALVSAGHREIVLTGINIGTYNSNGKTVMDVVNSLSDIPQLDRIRISSIEPTTIPKDLIYTMRDNAKLCAYLHIPLQAGTDTILGKMRRKYDLETFDEFIRFARETVPNICIGTDVIVGFPGETDALFEQCYRYLETAEIDYFHVFSYSERSLAHSRKFDGKVTPSAIKTRSERLRALSHQKKASFAKTQKNRTVPILFEQEKNGHWQGLSDNYLKVAVQSKHNLKNQLLEVRLGSGSSEFVFGTLAPKQNQAV